MSMTTLTDTPTRAAASATPTTMRAAVVKTSGEPLVVAEVPLPTPGPRQALVKVCLLYTSPSPRDRG